MGLLSAITGRTDEQNEEIERALADFHEAEKRKGQLYQSGEALQKKLSAARREQAEALFAGKLSDQTQQTIDDLEKAASANVAALRIADEKIVAAQRRLHLANSAGELKTLRRLTNKRTKYTAELVEALATYVKARAKVLETNDQITNSWPFGPAPLGALLDQREIDLLIAQDITRLSDVGDLDVNRPPGASHTLSFDKPLADQVLAAHEYLFKILEAGPGGIPKQFIPLDQFTGPGGKIKAPDVPFADFSKAITDQYAVAPASGVVDPDNDLLNAAPAPAIVPLSNGPQKQTWIGRQPEDYGLKDGVSNE